MPSGDPRTQGLIDWIDESNRLDWLVRRLNAAYALPEDITVVVMEDTDGPAYFPNLRAITMPPEFLGTILRLFEDCLYVRGECYRYDDPEDPAIGAFSWVFLHEAGHALIDLFGLPVIGLEEDAADQFATVFATSLERPWRAYYGAVLFQALAQNRGRPGVRDYWGEHALHEQRHTNILCWLYGYDPFKFVHVPTRFPEAADRLEGCGYEYRQRKNSWEKLLAPHSNT